jgi:hypothetical protein
MGKTDVISIITEVVNSFLGEVEYQPEDTINTSDINLQQEYDKLNRQLFGGTLSNVPLRWGARKTSLGHVHSLHNRYTGERKIEYLELSRFYKTSYRQFKNVLAHEMIHVKQIQNGRKGGHEWDFLSEMRRINGMGLGFAINVTNGEEIQMSDQILANASAKGKVFIAMIFLIDGKYYLNVTTPKVYEAESDFLFNGFERLVNRGKYRSVEITVVESHNPQLMQHRISRSFKQGFSYSPLDDKMLESLLNEKIIKSIKIKSGQPISVSEDVVTPQTSGEWEEEDISLQ